jgi:hypothetical protein
MSWRTHFKPHPAALAFNRFTTDEERRALEQDIGRHGLRQPMVTASVPNEEKVYVIDGISRLDAMEALGWQIVSAQGLWTGALAVIAQGRSNVIHHYGYTHEQIRHLVISLNAHRRHQTKEQLLRALAEAIKAEWEEFPANDGGKIKAESERGRGRPKDPLKARVAKDAEAAGVNAGKRTVERALADFKPQPKQPRRKQPKKEKTFEERIWGRWQAWLKTFLPGEVREVKKLVHEWSGGATWQQQHEAKTQVA